MNTETVPCPFTWSEGLQACTILDLPADRIAEVLIEEFDEIDDRMEGLGALLKQHVDSIFPFESNRESTAFVVGLFFALQFKDHA